MSRTIWKRCFRTNLSSPAERSEGKGTQAVNTIQAGDRKSSTAWVPFPRLALLGSPGMTAVLDVQRPSIRRQHGLVHHFAERGVREDGVRELGVGEFAGLRHHVTLDELGDFRADHMRA